MFHFGGGIITNILALGVYLLQSYAIYRLAVISRLQNPVFAFIPFFQLFMLGQLGDSMKYQNPHTRELLGKIPLAYALPIISIAGSILRNPLNLLATLLLSLGTVIVYYLVFYSYARENHVLFTLITCIPTLVTLLTILSVLPMIGQIFQLTFRLLGIASIIAPVAGPLLILYNIKGYRHYH